MKIYRFPILAAFVTRYIKTSLLPLAMLFVSMAAMAKENSIGYDSLPTPIWQEGFATVTGKIINYDPANDDNPNAIIYPRSSFGRYIDQRHGTVPVDSNGNFHLNVKLYQTHQPCFIDVPGYYGLVYLSPGDNSTLTIDYAVRRANGHQGDEGIVVWMNGEDSDINNMLATNAGHDVIWNSFGNNRGFQKHYTDNAAFIDSVNAHRETLNAQVDTMPFTDRSKQLLRLNIDGNATQSLLMAAIYQIVKPDSAYYSLLPALGVGSPMLRWASDYDTAISYCNNLYLYDEDSGTTLAQSGADFYESILATGKLNADETELMEGMIRYNIDRLPGNVLADRRQRLSRSVSFLTDSLRLEGSDKERAVKLMALLADDSVNDARKVTDSYLKFLYLMMEKYGTSLSRHEALIWDDDFGRESSAFFKANGADFNALFKKYDSEIKMIATRQELAHRIDRFVEITGIDNEEIRQNLIISIYSSLLLQGALVPDEVFEGEIKDFSPVAISFLSDQNEALRRILSNAVSNVSQMSPDADGDKIILDIVEKHKGKLIFIDIWNTWCGGCLKAMTDHEQYKADYTDKVAFVYLADETSPVALWDERIKAFTGDHYRLPLDQHRSLMERFNFSGYPSYIIINGNGDIVNTTNHIHSLSSELDQWLE